MLGLAQASLWPWLLKDWYGKWIHEYIRFEKHTMPFPAFAFLPSGSSRSVSEDNWDSASLWTTHEVITNFKCNMEETFKDMFNLRVNFCVLLRKLKLCVQILRCYHFFNIFWICWSRCLYCSGPHARRYTFNCTWKIRQIGRVCSWTISLTPAATSHKQIKVYLIYSSV